MGIIFESELLSNRLAELLQIQIQGSYRLDSRNGRLIWMENHGRSPAIHNIEPGSPRSRRIAAWLVGLLPIESQL